MNYITEFFDDKHHFWTNGTIICVLVLFSIFMADVVTTIIIINKGGTEFNQYMSPFVTLPLAFVVIKMIALNSIILSIRFMYDVIQDKFYTKYNTICIYFALLVPAIMTLCIVIHNLVVLCL